MRKWLLIGGILMGTLCGFGLLVSVGVWLINPPHPPTPTPTRGEGEQVAIVATDTQPLPLTPSPQAARGNTIEPTNTDVPTIEPTEVDMLSDVQRAMEAIPLLEIISVVVNDDARIFAGDLKGIVQVVWRTPSNDSLDVMKVQMQDIVCAYLGTGYTGYRLRMGGKNAANVTLITAAIEPDVLAQIDCEAGAINWENATSEWSVASGVQR